MYRLLDIRIPSSGGVVAAVRWLEYVTLLVFFGAAWLFFPPYGVLAGLPLLLLAVMLVPGRQPPALTHEMARFDALNALQANGYGLRARWLMVNDLPLSDRVAMEQWEVRRDTLIWISQCKSKLRPFPELGGIFEAREPKPDVMDDLEECLLTLSRLRRLVSLSRRLQLPI